MSENILSAIDLTKDAIESFSDKAWVLGFSGGKDSTAMLKVFVAALRKAKRRSDQISIIYCDTGVENPIIDVYVKDLFRGLKEEFELAQLDISLNILKSLVEERFFVRVIGRGYPPPTNSFRWCTKGLRIKPVARFINELQASGSIVMVGSRLDESEQRRRSINKMGGGHWQKQQGVGNDYQLFLPILHFDLSDVWDSVFMLDFPRAINPQKLEMIYRNASGECPIIKSPEAPACASGRFGCWTCTVVRKDKSAIKMIDAGHSELLPFLEFRNWLSEFRNMKEMRWPMRRNGMRLPGPFSLNGRRIILDRLKNLESVVGHSIIDEEETNEIARLWALDVDHAAEQS
jgi:DNA sulfur modification protein DndC